MYGVSAWNSAAHVSTRWKDAVTPSSFRRARTSSGFDPAVAWHSFVDVHLRENPDATRHSQTVLWLRVESQHGCGN